MKITLNYIPLSERIAKLHISNNNFDNQTKKQFDQNKTTGNTSIRSELSKAGMANIFMGQKQSGLNKNPLLQKNQENTLTENTMNNNIIPIKEMIIEEGLTNFIQNNASKISGGLLLGAGAAAAHAANGGDFSFGNHDTPPAGTPGADKWNGMSDFEKDVAKNSITTDVHDATKPKGLFGNLTHSLGTGMNNLRSENKMQDMQDKHKDYTDTVNGEGALLNGSDALKVGGTALGLGTAGLLASKVRRRR